MPSRSLCGMQRFLSRLACVGVVFGVALSTGCTLRMGRYTAAHELLRDEVGETPLRTANWAPAIENSRRGMRPLPAEKKAQLALAASSMVGMSRVEVAGERYRMDCSGVARAIYAKAGLRLGGRALRADENDVSILYRWLEESGALHQSHPQIGDLVFFDDTYDRNGDGERNDPLSHVGVVEKILDDGTIVYVHHVSGGILRYRMNLAKPGARLAPHNGARLNHDLRRASAGTPARTGAELFRAFGSMSAPPEEAWWTLQRALTGDAQVRSDS